MHATGDFLLSFLCLPLAFPFLLPSYYSCCFALSSVAVLLLKIHQGFKEL